MAGRGHARLLLASVLWMVLAMGGVLTSCHKDLFEVEQYREVVQMAFPVDTVDARHDWNLLRNTIVAVQANVDDPEIERLVILTADPSSGEAEVVGSCPATRDNTAHVSVTVGKGANRYYAALLTTTGLCYSTPFTLGTGNEVTFPDEVKPVRVGELPVQMYTYLFEASYPRPGDFDYNDLVLRMAAWMPDTYVLKLRVTLAAVGDTKQIAAAVHLPGVPYEQVEEVTIDEGTPFDEGYPIRRNFLESKAAGVEGRNKELVVNLFEDAHWSLNPKQESSGLVARMNYNTTLDENSHVSAFVPEKTRTYTIRLKEGFRLGNYTTQRLDPFILSFYNSLKFEVHTYDYKYEELLWDYYDDPNAYSNHYAWALLVPSSTFLYPFEGTPLCSYKKEYGSLPLGAYNKYGHSFGEWVENHGRATDWWLYPTSSLVYGWKGNGE